MFRASVLLATASLAAGVLTAPGAALAADTTTDLTAAEMSAALKGVAGTTAQAELPGYGGDVLITIVGKGTSLSGSVKFAVDPAGKRGSFVAAGGLLDGIRVYAEGGKGQWVYFNSKEERDAVAMAGHPNARYAFRADAKLTLDSWADDSVPAASTVVVEDAKHAGTKTVHDDGSTDYAYTVDKSTKIVFGVDAQGVITGAKVTDTGLDETFTWNYGERTVTLPSASQIVGQPLLTQALAYLNTAGKVKAAAVSSAEAVQGRSHKKTIKVADLRKWTRAQISDLNSEYGVKVLVVADIKGGVRISARNPFTKVTSAWTVKASGKRAIASKA